ncbi:MAG: hypothetical protein ACLU9S_21220 [Oscillospiraceae bacterium]
MRLSVRDIFVRDPLLFRDFLTCLGAAMINELLWGAGAAMNSVVIGHLGSAAVAANSVAQVARQLATVVAFGIAKRHSHHDRQGHRREATRNGRRNTEEGLSA